MDSEVAMPASSLNRWSISGCNINTAEGNDHSLRRCRLARVALRAWVALRAGALASYRLTARL